MRQRQGFRFFDSLVRDQEVDGSNPFAHPERATGLSAIALAINAALKDVQKTLAATAQKFLILQVRLDGFSEFGIHVFFECRDRAIPSVDPQTRIDISRRRQRSGPRIASGAP